MQASRFAPQKLAASVLNYVQLRWAGWLFIAVLAFGAVWSARVALQSKPFDERIAKGPSLKHEPDFEAKQIDGWRTSADGKSRTRFTAETAVHYRDDLSSNYTQLRFALVSATQQTDVTADFAKAYNDGEALDLSGSVQVQRTFKTKGQPQSSLETTQLTLYPDSGVATSRSASLFKQGARSAQANGGFDYRDAEASIVLLGAVKVVTLPVKK